MTWLLLQRCCALHSFRVYVSHSYIFINPILVKTARYSSQTKFPVLLNEMTSPCIGSQVQKKQLQKRTILGIKKGISEYSLYFLSCLGRTLKCFAIKNTTPDRKQVKPVYFVCNLLYDARNCVRNLYESLESSICYAVVY